MNELQVVVEQTPGTIGWNFEELKTQLTEAAKAYEATQYTDETIGDAKKDLAMLRKLQKQVNDRRISIKKVCLAPYDAFEAQAKELTAIIGRPIAKIDENVKAYDERIAQEKKERIRTFFMDIANEYGLPVENDDLMFRLLNNIFDRKWLNKTCKDSDWQSDIKCGVDRYKIERLTLSSIQSSFTEEGLNRYDETFNFDSALNYMNALQHQKELVEAKVRIEQEEKERHIREAEQRKATEAAAKAAIQQQKEEDTRKATEPANDIPKHEALEAEAAAHNVPYRATTNPDPPTYNAPHTTENAAPTTLHAASPEFILKVHSLPELNELTGYCDICGIEYEVVK